MDAATCEWYFSDMDERLYSSENVPSWHLYGEARAFPDILHCEEITDRAAGLDWKIAPHRHPHLHQFFMIRGGSVEITVEGKRYQPDLPCVMTIPPGVVHGFEFAAGTDGYVVTVPLKSAPEMLDPQHRGASQLSRFAVVPADDILMREFDALHDEHAGRRRGRAAMLKAQALMLSCLVLRALPQAEPPVPFGHARYFEDFQDMVQKHFRDGWQPRDYAEALGVSSRHLGRLCQAATGQSPSAFLSSALMQEACRLLVYTRDTVATISYQLGFDDPSYFSRAFRRHMGVSPGTYRAAFEEE